MVSGARHTTAATIRPGLQVLRTQDSPLVSSVFFMCLPDKVQVLQHIAKADQPALLKFWMAPIINHKRFSFQGPEGSSWYLVVIRIPSEVHSALWPLSTAKVACRSRFMWTLLHVHFQVQRISRALQWSLLA